MRGFLENNKGNIATVFGFLVFPIVVAIGAGVEFGNVANMRRLVQDAADAGAIAAANKLNVLSQGAAADGVEATGTDTAMFQIKDNPNLTNVSFTTVVDKKTGTVTVNGKATIPSLFNVLPNSSLDFSVNSVAETLNQMPLCVMQLSDNGDDDDMLSMTNQSQLLAGGCLIHSNENIGVSDQASIMASRIQAVGTVKGNTKPGGQGGALKIDDPFKNMDLEFEKICKAHHYGQLKQTGTKTWRLPAGVHCGSNSSTAQMTIILEPGEHYFLKDFKFNGNTQLQGEDVVMIFADGANPKFWGATSVNLSARKSGPFSGFLLITARDNNDSFDISSSNVDKLLGTIYMPNAKLNISAGGNVAEDSAWSVIVAKEINVSKKSQLIINKNYVGSGVPVPSGVGNKAVTGKPKLIH